MATAVIGAGWSELLNQLVEELRSVDPDAVLEDAVVNADGLLRLRARLSPHARQAGNRLLREYERRAITTCELCGGGGRVYAGRVVIIRCPSCV